MVVSAARTINVKNVGVGVQAEEARNTNIREPTRGGASIRLRNQNGVEVVGGTSVIPVGQGSGFKNEHLSDG